MKRWSARQLLVLVLAVCFTAGMSLAVVQASSMMGKMTVASDMGASGSNDCQGCPAGGSDGAKAMACAAVCVAPILAVLPQAAPTTAARTPAAFPGRDLRLVGRTSAPEPHPPKSDATG